MRFIVFSYNNRFAPAPNDKPYTLFMICYSYLFPINFITVLNIFDYRKQTRNTTYMEPRTYNHFGFYRILSSHVRSEY